MPCFAWSGRDLTTRQTSFRQPVRLIRRARHPQCSGIRALSAAGPAGHQGLHGERWRQGHPGRGLPRRGHHHPRGRGGPPGPALRPWSQPRNALVRHSRTRLPRQDQCNCHCGRIAPTRGRRRLRLRGSTAFRDGLPNCSSPWRRDEPGGRRGPARRPAHERRRVRRRGLRVLRCWSARGPTWSPSWWPPPRRPTNSPTAGGRPATAPPGCGRSASARTATWRWVKTPWPEP